MSTLFNTPGIGGIVVLVVVGCLVVCYALTLRWIIREDGRLGGEE